MTVAPLWPYSINPNSYAQQALTPQPVNQPVMPQATAARFGPANQALYDQLHAANLQQNAVPGLLAAYQANPALAQQAGGLLAASPGQGNPLASNFYRLGQPNPAAGASPTGAVAPGLPGAVQTPEQIAAINAQIQAIQAQQAQQAQLAAYLAQLGGTGGSSGGGDGSGADGGSGGAGAGGDGGGSASP